MATGGSLCERFAKLQQENTELTLALAFRDMTIARLTEENRELRKRLEALIEKLNQNSRNSHRPPSSDPPGKAPKHRSKKSARNRGAQPGHENQQWQPYPPDQVDQFIHCKPDHCAHCRAHLYGEDPNPQREQRVDLPPVKPSVIEYLLHTVICRVCGHVNMGKLPAGVTAAIFGPRIQALVGTLTGAYRLSKREVQVLLQELFQVNLSLGMVARLEQATSAALAQPVAEAQAYVRQQPLTFLDETGWREAKKRAWLWTFASKAVITYVIRRSRGADVVKELLGEGYSGVSHTDRWSGYKHLPLDQHQVCWSHLRRDFERVGERRGLVGRLGRELKDLADKILHQWGRIQEDTLTWEGFKIWVGRTQRKVSSHLETGLTCRHKATATFCRNLLKLGKALWTFSRVKGVEPTNNFAERMIRKPVLWRKGSFGTDSPHGSRYAERILTVVMSLRAQSRNLLDYLVQACQAARLSQPAPSLLPIA